MSSQLSSKSQQQMEELRATLESLKAYELPERLQTAMASLQQPDDGSENTVDPALIERYEKARSEYLRRRIQQTFAAYVGSFSAEDGSFENPPLPSPEQEAELKQRMAEAKQQVQEMARGAHRQMLEFQQKYATFCARREELQKVVKDMEQLPAASNDESMCVGDDEDADVDDDALAQEEEKLSILQQRKAQLEEQLFQLRQENKLIESKTAATKAEMEAMLEGSAVIEEPESPTGLADEMSARQQELQNLQEMKIYYDNLRSVLEELTGMKILSMDKVALDGRNSGYDDTQGTAATVGIRMKVLLMEEHEILIVIQPNSDNPDQLRVVSARLLTSPVTWGSDTGGADENSINPNNNTHNKTVQLVIPPLDDLVRLCAKFPPGEELRFLLREAMARIRSTEARAKELTTLRDHVLTKIGQFSPDGGGFGGTEQEVVCSLNECLTAVLRLTTDCPLVAGSVYLDKLVGFGGWDVDVVDKIRARVSEQLFSSPVALIKELQNEVERLQREEGVNIPKTPTLPLRSKPVNK